MTKQVLNAKPGPLAPMIGKIDYSRGVTIRKHMGTGVDVIMYKDTPGVYLSWHGTKVSEVMAKEAGFPVEILGREKLRRERLDAAGLMIDKELGQAPGMETVVAEKDGFRIVDIGQGRFVVKDPEGFAMHKAWLGREMADKLLQYLVPEKVIEQSKQPLFKGVQT